VEVPETYNIYGDAAISVDPTTKMDFSHILEKPFYIGNVAWATTAVVDQRLGVFTFPTAFTTLPLIRIPFLSCAKWRGRMCAFIQVLATPFHQGTVMAVALPYEAMTSVETISGTCPSPHVLLSANQSTSACLEIPFSSPTDLAECFTSVNDVFGLTTSAVTFAQLKFFVLNPLLAPASGSTAVSISVHIMFKELEFYVPNTTPGATFLTEASVISAALDTAVPAAKKLTADAIDSVRTMVRGVTGLGYPTMPLIEQIMRPLPITPLNPTMGVFRADRFTPFTDFVYTSSDSTFCTDVDEMLISNIISKPGYLTTFKVTTSDLVGAYCFSCPIGPFNKIVDFTSDTAPLLQKMSYFARFWRGSVIFDFHASASNAHVAKFLVVKRYGLDKGSTVPTYNNVVGMQTETFEVSAGGQIHSVVCEFNSQTNVLPCQYGYETVPRMHGVIYVYLLQPLMATPAVATSININVFVRAGPDFRFYGYQDMLGFSANVNSSIITLSDSKDDEGIPEFIAEASVAPYNVTVNDVLTNKENSVVDAEVSDDILCNRMRPIISIRDFIRRPQVTQRILFPQNTETLSINISDLLNGVSPRTSTSMQALRTFFLGFKGGIRIRINVIHETDKAGTVSARYVPPLYKRAATSFVENDLPVASELLNITKYGWRPTDFSPGYTGGMQYPVNMAAVSLNDYLEFELPLENIFKFNLFKGYYINEAAMGLGDIIVTIPRYYTLSDLYNTYLEVWVSYSDEARFGFQAYNPKFYWTYATATGASPAFTTDDFNKDISDTAKNAFFYTKTA